MEQVSGDDLNPAEWAPMIKALRETGGPLSKEELAAINLARLAQFGDLSLEMRYGQPITAKVTLTLRLDREPVQSALALLAQKFALEEEG